MPLIWHVCHRSEQGSERYGRIRTIHALVAACGVITVLSGCGGNSPDTSEKAAPAAAWQVPAEPDPDVRDKIRGLFEGSSVRFAAEQELVQRCMASKDFRYVKLTSSASDVHPTMGPDNYGIPIKDAKRTGYNLQERFSGPDQDPDNSGLNTMTEEQRQAWGEAFYGPESAKKIRVTLPDGSQFETSAQGCLSESRAKIFGSIEDMLESQNFAGNLPIEVRRRATADPKIKELNSKWSACMKDAGYPGLADPESARNQASQGYEQGSDPAVFDTEVKIATADATCEDSQNYASQRRHVEDRYYTAALTVYESEITAVREVNERALKQARAILAE